MELADIRKIAEELGIHVPRRTRKADLIRRIQDEEEGSFPCFGTAEADCDQLDCRWRADCLGLGSVLSEEP